MPALAPIPPDNFKAILEKDGFTVDLETEYNWTLSRDDSPPIIVVLPKKGEFVSVEIMMSTLDKIKMNPGTFFDLLSQV